MKVTSDTADQRIRTQVTQMQSGVSHHDIVDVLVALRARGCWSRDE